MTKRWRCPKCNATAITPLPALAVSCVACTKTARRTQTEWMRPDEAPTDSSEQP